MSSASSNIWDISAQLWRCITSYRNLGAVKKHKCCLVSCQLHSRLFHARFGNPIECELLPVSDAIYADCILYSWNIHSLLSHGGSSLDQRTLCAAPANCRMRRHLPELLDASRLQIFGEDSQLNWKGKRYIDLTCMLLCVDVCSQAWTAQWFLVFPRTEYQALQCICKDCQCDETSSCKLAAAEKRGDLIWPTYGSGSDGPSLQWWF